MHFGSVREIAFDLNLPLILVREPSILFDSETINDTATYDDPIQFPSGIEHVLVNGEFVVKDNNSTGAVPGRAIP